MLEAGIRPKCYPVRTLENHSEMRVRRLGATSSLPRCYPLATCRLCRLCKVCIVFPGGLDLPLHATPCAPLNTLSKMRVWCLVATSSLPRRYLAATPSLPARYLLATCRMRRLCKVCLAFPGKLPVRTKRGKRTRPSSLVAGWLLPQGPRCLGDAAQPCAARGKNSSI